MENSDHLAVSVRLFEAIIREGGRGLDLRKFRQANPRVTDKMLAVIHLYFMNMGYIEVQFEPFPIVRFIGNAADIVRQLSPQTDEDVERLAIRIMLSTPQKLFQWMIDLVMQTLEVLGTALEDVKRKRKAKAANV